MSVAGDIPPKRADEDWFAYHERTKNYTPEQREAARVASQGGGRMGDGSLSNEEWLAQYNQSQQPSQTAEEARLAAAAEARLAAAAEEARLAAAAEEEGRLAAAAEEARLAAEEEDRLAAQEAQEVREAAAKEARGAVMSIDQRWYGPQADGSYWQNPNHQDYDPTVLTPGASTGTGAGTGAGADPSLFGYYRDALNLVSDDEGLAALATPASTAFRSAGNPFASNTASNTTGTVPNYTYERAQVPGTYDVNRRPGSRGQRYFSDAAFVPQGSPQRQAVRDTYANQASDAQLVNRANMAQQRQFEAQPRPTYSQPSATPMQFGTYTPPVNPASGAAVINPAPTENDLIAFLAQQRKNEEEKTGQEVAGEEKPTPIPTQMAVDSTGIASLARGGLTSAYAMGGTPQTQGYYLGGATDGMADRIPARIDNNQEARLSDGEFVIPADVVSHLGNGNSSAGAKNLYGMMDRVRMARTGNKQQGKQIDPNKFIPKR